MIRIRGAREHNLKNLNINIGRGITAVTGISGSGKTSLVFDTIYREAKKRLFNTISTSRPGGWRYQLSQVDVDSIDGLGPSIAVEQNVLNRNPNSILASAAGLHPFLRILYSNYATRYCIYCGSPLVVRSEDEIINSIDRASKVEDQTIFVPILNGIRGSHTTLLSLLEDEFGVDNLRVDGEIWDMTPLDPDCKHHLSVDVGRIRAVDNIVQIREVVQNAFALGSHAITVRSSNQDLTYVNAPVCAACGAWFGELEPKHFHQNCHYCGGSGCNHCGSTGLHPQAANVQWRDLLFTEILEYSVSHALELFEMDIPPESGERLYSEIIRRLQALSRVGLGYLMLNRPSPSLSRGESQRVRIAIAMTNKLEDILYVLDEPTIGQHPMDIIQFLPAFREMCGPVMFVEHDRLSVLQADEVIDLGPGAGDEGGEVVFQGSPQELIKSETTTGKYFGGKRTVHVPIRRPPPDSFIIIRGAKKHNLTGLDIAIPIGRMTVITGVSGSGKSTLVEHVLLPTIKLGKPVSCEELDGSILKPVMVDQTPIGRNPRSNPATYTKLSDIIRELYSSETGYSPSHFSFNRSEGYCPSCKGMGAIEVKMQFLQSEWITCSDCSGQRFNEDIRSAKIEFSHDQLSIADLYQLSIEDVRQLFKNESRLPSNQEKSALRILDALIDVGLGYLTLGQSSPTLSGGEAQRVKLTKYLGRANLYSQLLILDEPSTGLHEKDLRGLLIVLDRLVRSGATIVVVEHNLDVIQASDWIIDLGPGAGAEGGNLLYCGSAEEFLDVSGSPTAEAMRVGENLFHIRQESEHVPLNLEVISIRNARENNLKGVDVDFPKGKFSIVTGVSGSGKSSLVKDVLEREARRRYLESLSMYERQGTNEGAEALVDSVAGLGVTLSVQGLQSHVWSALTHFTRRASVGKVTELNHHLAVLLSSLGQRTCLVCGGKMIRGNTWLCQNCGIEAEIRKPHYFSTTNYASACRECSGVGSIYEPEPSKLIVNPGKPLCNGAMHSPGYWPQTYLCKDTGIMQALGNRYEFDPTKTPWNQMTEQARKAFLYGDEKPLQRTYRSKSTGKLITSESSWEGFYGGWVRDWDVHGTYTNEIPCPSCSGAGLLPEFLAVTLSGFNVFTLSEMPLSTLVMIIEMIQPAEDIPPMITASLHTMLKRIKFLMQVGLGYLNLNRPTGTLSAGEAQRIQLGGLLGSELTSLTILLDEPSRGMHPSELNALSQVLMELRDQGNTVIVVEHDLQLINQADYIVDMGPGAGTQGGQVVACGDIPFIIGQESITGKWLKKERYPNLREIDKEKPSHAIQFNSNDAQTNEKWMQIDGATENNLKGDRIRIPIGKMVGICGVSGSGKSTLLLDTVGRALVTKKHSTSFSQEPVTPGRYKKISNAPGRTVIVDQTRNEIRSPAAYLGLIRPLIKMYAQSGDAQALGLDEKRLRIKCSSCKGQGRTRIEMGFLPDVLIDCETCRGTGYLPEAWQVRVNGIALPDVNQLTLDEVFKFFPEQNKISRVLEIVHSVGLGYLNWLQPGFSLSGGEAQRLKIVKELSKQKKQETLYILDEPTVGQHMEDVSRVVQVFRKLVNEGHTVVVIEHHSYLLTECDWVIELGPVGGPDGGYLIAEGTPPQVAAMDTPTSPYLSQSLAEAV